MVSTEGFLSLRKRMPYEPPNRLSLLNFTNCPVRYDRDFKRFYFMKIRRQMKWHYRKCSQPLLISQIQNNSVLQSSYTLSFVVKSFYAFI